jgi:hypothetical protein
VDTQNGECRPLGKVSPRFRRCQKRYAIKPDKPLILLARPERFELPTLGFEVRCSIQLSYGRLVSYLIDIA